MSAREIEELIIHPSETVQNPPEELALRASGHLLRGLVSIYAKQCHFFLGTLLSFFLRLRPIFD
jgi:hypothetical protein